MQILNRKHPLYFVLTACICVGAAAIAAHTTSGSWKTGTFWKVAAVVLVGVLAILSARLFTAVSKLYPGLNPFSSNH